MVRLASSTAYTLREGLQWWGLKWLLTASNVPEAVMSVFEHPQELEVTLRVMRPVPLR